MSKKISYAIGLTILLSSLSTAAPISWGQSKSDTVGTKAGRTVEKGKEGVKTGWKETKKATNTGWNATKKATNKGWKWTKKATKDGWKWTKEAVK